MIYGEKILIRPMTEDDFEIFYNWMSNREHLGDFVEPHMVRKSTFIDNFSKSFESSGKFFCVIEDKEKGPVGAINYFTCPGSNSSLEVGILIAESSVRAKGYGSEALKLFIDYLFNSKTIGHIQFRTRADNIPMIKSGLKSGFKKVGILEDYSFMDGEYKDFCLMSLTRRDWEKICT